MPGLPLEAANIKLTDFKKGAVVNAHQKKRYRLVEELLAQIPNRGRGLDYGCGLGDQAYYFSDKFDSIIGVDVTPERVAWANKEFAPIEFQVCASDSLAFADKSFDTVLSSVVINWVEDTDQYLMNMHRVLVTGGHMVLLVKSPDALRDALRRLIGKGPAETTVQGSKLVLETMKTTLTGMGFRIVDVGFFYDPVVDVLTHMKNILLEIIRLPMRVAGVPKYAHYYGILVQKRA
jgi:ubiquinone/menaquinone biosynthesis C-methylase UbiE